MRIILGMSIRQVMSTTTTLPMRIGSPRLRHIARRNTRLASDGCYDLNQGTEIRHSSENNIHEMPESPKEIADCQLVESVISFDALYESMLKCRRNVSWKPSVKQFLLNSTGELLSMNEKLSNGTWQNSKPKEVKIYYPKRRTALSIPFRDRVYQRSINDNVLYPEMTRHFVIGNCACQKGKGTDFAMRLAKKYIRNFFANHGLNGHLLQMDLTGYYYSIVHKYANEDIERYIRPCIVSMVTDVLEYQYMGERGYNPGSQMVQIVGITHPDPIDHMIKEELGIDDYIRYNDDFWLLHESKEHLEYCRERIEEELRKKELQISEKKTHITPLSEGFTFLGFNWRVTETGKILCFVKSESVKHERKKLYRLVNKGDRAKADECYQSWKAHAGRGNSYLLFEKLDKYYNELWESKYESS